MNHHTTMSNARNNSGPIIKKPTPKGRAERNCTERDFFRQPKKSQIAPVNMHAAKASSKMPASKMKKPGAAIIMLCTERTHVASYIVATASWRLATCHQNRADPALVAFDLQPGNRGVRCPTCNPRLIGASSAVLVPFRSLHRTALRIRIWSPGSNTASVFTVLFTGLSR